MFTKLKQKALYQPKQKKSKSAEFLMEERAAAQGTENPTLDISTETSACWTLERGEIRRDRPNHTLAARRGKMELQASARPRGNEITRNCFGPPTAGETDPRRCGMEVGTEDELELNEKELFYQMSQILHEDAATIVDLPGVPQLDKMAEQEVDTKGGGVEHLGLPSSTCLSTDLEEGIPSYIEKLKESVQDDMILLGSPSQEQYLYEAMT
ncbi:orofacial cleft 1 candidate gene 1 protein [Arapaima gigas]